MKLYYRNLLALSALCLLTGCSNQPAPSASSVAATEAHPASSESAPNSAAPDAAKLTPLSEEKLAQVRANEAGVVPILEYHDITNGRSSMCRSAAAFRRDLERLYKENYRPVLLKDFLANRIDVPPGMTPVIFTFDDARQSQFHYKPDGTIDPDCAIGILQAFAKKHPDFPVRATFYVLPKVGFGPPSAQAAKKMQALLDMGCEIGNHTVTHRSLKSLSDTEVQKEIADCVRLVQKLVPNTEVNTLALPMGISPRNRALAASGEYKGQKYTNKAVLLVGANPAPAPASPKYDPLRLPRIQACEGDAGITYWLDDLKRHPERRYISDGDPTTVTVPKAKTGQVDTSKLSGATLRLY